MFTRIIAATFGLLSLAFMSIAPAHASTVTLTFDGVTNGCGVCGPGFPASITEQGYTISGSPSTIGGPGSVHLDDGGSSFSNTVSFSGPSSFAVTSVDVTGYGSHFGFDTRSGFSSLAYNNVLFQGFRNGALVANGIFSTGIVGGLFNVTFGNLFSNLDMFSISQTGPSAAEKAGGAYCNNAPCAHVDIDNVTLTAAIPLPAMAPALAGVLALMGMFGWKRRAS